MEPNIVLLTTAVIFGGVGIALLFVGLLMALLVALGNKQYGMGIAMCVFFPVAYIYGYIERKKMHYANTLLYLGLILFCAFLALLWWEIEYRLGLDFFDLMRDAKPKHSLSN